MYLANCPRLHPWCLGLFPCPLSNKAGIKISLLVARVKILACLVVYTSLHQIWRQQLGDTLAKYRLICAEYRLTYKASFPTFPLFPTNMLFFTLDRTMAIFHALTFCAFVFQYCFNQFHSGPSTWKGGLSMLFKYLHFSRDLSDFRKQVMATQNPAILRGLSTYLNSESKAA